MARHARVVFFQDPRLYVIVKRSKHRIAPASSSSSDDSRYHFARLPTRRRQNESYLVKVSSAAELLGVKKSEARKILREGRFVHSVEELHTRHYQERLLKEHRRKSTDGLPVKSEAELLELVSTATKKLRSVSAKQQQDGVTCKYKDHRLHIRLSSKVEGKLSITALRTQKALGEGMEFAVYDCKKMSSPRRSMAWLSAKDLTPRSRVKLKRHLDLLKSIIAAAKDWETKHGSYPAGIPKRIFPVCNSAGDLMGLLAPKCDGDAVTIASDDKIPATDRVDMVTQILEGFVFLYLELGIIDADRKPDNILCQKVDERWLAHHTDLGGSCQKGKLGLTDLLQYTFSREYSSPADLVDRMLKLENQALNNSFLKPEITLVRDLKSDDRDPRAIEKKFRKSLEKDHKRRMIFESYCETAFEYRTSHACFAMGVTIASLLSGFPPLASAKLKDFPQVNALSPELYFNIQLKAHTYVCENAVESLIAHFGATTTQKLTAYLDQMLSPMPEKRPKPEEMLTQWKALVVVLLEAAKKHS